MDFNQMAIQLSPEIYQQLKTAVEIGRWADGKLLSAQQREISLQAILRYEIEHLPPEQRTGYIEPKKSGACHSDHDHSHADEQPVRWQQ